MKKFLAVMLSVTLICTMIASVFVVASADGLTQEQKNTRTTLPPKGSDGMYSISANWNKNEVYFSDESYMSSPPDETDDTYIQRMSSSEQMNAGLYPYMMLSTWGGSVSSSATKADYAAGNFWYEMDFGISTKVTRIDYWTILRNDWNRSVLNNPSYGNNTAASVTPKQYKVLWSNDKVNWMEETFTFDYTDPTNPMHEVYVDVLEKGSESEYLADLPYEFQLTFDTPAKGRYFRIALVAPTMDFDAEADAESTTKVTAQTYGLRFFDTSADDAEVLEPTAPVVTAGSITNAVKGDATYAVTYDATLAEVDAGAKVIIALYNGNEMVAVKTVSVDETSAVLNAANATKAKMFILSSLTSAKPLIVNADYDIN